MLGIMFSMDATLRAQEAQERRVSVPHSVCSPARPPRSHSLLLTRKITCPEPDAFI